MTWFGIAASLGGILALMAAGGVMAVFLATMLSEVNR